MAMFKLNVKGMHCTSCETILKEDIGTIAGVSKVTADHKKGIVCFEGQKEALAQAKAAIENDGYSVEPGV